MRSETPREKAKGLVATVLNRNPEKFSAYLADGADVHYGGEAALRYAVYLGYADMAEALLKKGANVHVDGEEPLYIAIRAKDVPLMDLLVAHGADVNAMTDLRQDSLTNDDFKTIADMKARSLKSAFDKNAGVLREKVRVLKPRSLKPGGPC